MRLIMSVLIMAAVTAAPVYKSASVQIDRANQTRAAAFVAAGL